MIQSDACGHQRRSQYENDFDQGGIHRIRRMQQRRLPDEAWIKRTRAGTDRGQRRAGDQSHDADGRCRCRFERQDCECDHGRRIKHRAGEQHRTRSERVHEPAEKGRDGCKSEHVERARGPGDFERARLPLHEQQDREPGDADRKPPQHGRDERRAQPRHLEEIAITLQSQHRDIAPLLRVQRHAGAGFSRQLRRTT